MIEYREQFFESPAEREIIHFLSKLLNCELIEQFWVRTEDNKFYRLDFVLIKDNERIGIEIDGKLWHNEEKDVERDYGIIESGYVDNIIRFSASNAKMYPEIIAYYLRKLYPNFFDNKYGNEEVINQHLISNYLSIHNEDITDYFSGIIIESSIKIENLEEEHYSIADGLTDEEADKLTSEYKTFKIIKRLGSISNNKLLINNLIREMFPFSED